MRRSGFKQKTRKPLKRGKLKKASKQSISKIQRTLWKLCKQIIRTRYGSTCYTCSAINISGSNWHTGHLWSKASLGAYLKYDLRVLRPQCYKCNIHYGGMGAVFYSRMLRENGAEFMEKLEADKRVTVKAYDHYLNLITEYSEILKNI